MSFVAAAVGIALAMTGCAGAAPTPQASSTATQAPSSAPSATAAVWPAQLVDTTCDDLVPAAVRNAVFAQSLPALSGSSNASDAKTFSVTAIENAGGLSCGWELLAGTDNFEDNMIVSVKLLPRAQAASAQISTEMDAQNPSTQISDMTCNWRACMAEALVGEYWVSITTQGFAAPPEGGVPPAEAAQLADTAISVVSALAPSTEPTWPGSKAEWATSCEQFVPVESLGEALNLPGATFTRGYNFEVSNIGPAAVLTSGGLVCGVATPSGSRIGTINVLPESAEPFTLARDVALQSEHSEAVQIEGLDADGAFVTERLDMPGSATLDLNLNGAWVVLSMSGTISDGPEMSARDRLIDLATALAAAR